MDERQKALRRALEILQPFRKYFLASILMLAAYESLSLLGPYIVGQAINSIQAGKPFEHVLKLIALAFVITIMTYAFGALRDKFELRKIDFPLPRHFTNGTLEQVLNLSIGQHRSQNSGITQSVVSKGQGALNNMVFLLLYTILPVIVTVVATSTMLLWFNWRVGLVVLAGMVIYLTVSIRNTLHYYPEVRRLNDLSHRTGKFYTEILRHPTLVQIQSQEKRVRTEHKERLDHLIEEDKRVWIPYIMKMWVNLTLHSLTKYSALGKSKFVTDEMIAEVAKLASIDRFQHRLIEGWDTKIGENGVKLSGGERQRVGIARALIKDASILILDEATSRLDVENESIIKEAVRKAAQGRTTVTIAHRLSTVRDADRIFIMSKGSIVGSGKHEDLYETSDVYRNLINKQLFHL